MRHAARPSECAPAASGARAGGQYTCGPYLPTPGWPPWHPGTLSVWRMADARRVRAAYRQLTPPRAGLAHGACSLTAPCRHRRPHSSHTDRHRCHCQLTYLVRLESAAFHPQRPPTRRLRHTCHRRDRTRAIASFTTIYRLRLPLRGTRTRRTAAALTTTTSTMTTSSTIDHPQDPTTT